jgi:hypothetical protein
MPPYPPVGLQGRAVTMWTPCHRRAEGETELTGLPNRFEDGAQSGVRMSDRYTRSCSHVQPRSTTSPSEAQAQQPDLRGDQSTVAMQLPRSYRRILYFAHPGSKGSAERDRWDHWSPADQTPKRSHREPPGLDHPARCPAREAAPNAKRLAPADASTLCWAHGNFPESGKFPSNVCSSPPSDTQSGSTSPFSEHRLNTRTARLMPAASPRR